MPDSLTVFFNKQDKEGAEWIRQLLLALGWNATLQDEDAIALTSPGSVYITGSNSQRILVPLDLRAAGDAQASAWLAKEVERILGFPSPRDVPPPVDLGGFPTDPRDVPPPGASRAAGRFQPIPEDQLSSSSRVVGLFRPLEFPPEQERRLPMEWVPPPGGDHFTVFYAKQDRKWAEWVRDQLLNLGWKATVQVDDSGAESASGMLNVRQPRRPRASIIVWVKPSKPSTAVESVPGQYRAINISQVGEIQARALVAEAVKTVFEWELTPPTESGNAPPPTLPPILRPKFTPSPTIQTNASPRTPIFISYNHKDQEWLEQLKVHLQPLQRQGQIDIWDDSRIKAGQQWRKEIAEAIHSAKIAILLVTADFMASDFIQTNELPSILKAAEQRGVRILPVIIGWSSFKYSPLAEFQAVNSPDEPIINLKERKRGKVFLTIYEAVRESLES